MIKIPEDIMKIARDYAWKYTMHSDESLTVTIASAILHERERCAKIADCLNPDVKSPKRFIHSSDIADAIRSGGRP